MPFYIMGKQVTLNITHIDIDTERQRQKKKRDTGRITLLSLNVFPRKVSIHIT